MARRLGWLALGLLLAALAAGRAGRFSPLLDLANLVALPVAGAAVLLSAALALTARGWGARLGAGFAALAAILAAWPPAPAPSVCAPGGTSLRLAWFNAQGMRDPVPVLRWLEREQPLAVAFGELGPESAAVHQAVAALYPHKVNCHRRGRCPTMLYSRIAPQQAAALAKGDPQNRKALSALRAELPLADGTRLALVAVHLSRPLPLGRQREELRELQPALASPADTVLLGDFNATKRMHTLAGFARANGYAIAAADRPTWPRHIDGHKLPPLIQIDHVLVGRSWAVRALRTEDLGGSDHRALVADLCRRA